MKTLSIQQSFNLLLNGFSAVKTVVLNSTMAAAFEKAGIQCVQFAPISATKRSKKVVKTPIKTTRKSGYKGIKTTTTVAPVLKLSAIVLYKGKELLKTLGRKTQGTLITLQAEILCLDVKEIEKSIAFAENKGGNLSTIRQALSALKEAVCL